jgi:hypothetical protein
MRYDNNARMVDLRDHFDLIILFISLAFSKYPLYLNNRQYMIP